MGGYVTFPGGMMAALSGVPLVLHEQNSVAGLANRVLAVVADRVLTGFPEALKKGDWVGNPVRPKIAALASPAERYRRRQGPLNILVVGGSLGAAILNADGTEGAGPACRQRNVRKWCISPVRSIWKPCDRPMRKRV